MKGASLLLPAVSTAFLATGCQLVLGYEETEVWHGNDAGSDASAGTGGQGGTGDAGGAAGTGVGGTAGTGVGGTAGTGVGGASGTNGDCIFGQEQPPSCEGLGYVCAGRSCCEHSLVPGGTFQMGTGEQPSPDYIDCSVEGCDDEKPEHAVEVHSFYLDTFEVTVARFRRFFDGYDGAKPSPGDGANPSILADPGWSADWYDELPANKAELTTMLQCGPPESQNWTIEAGLNENMPINCVNWFTAFAFCAWDGGRLPTEAEWEFAAAAGAENRMYPWGAEHPGETDAGLVLANYRESLQTPRIDVGSFPAGRGRWCHWDLAGNVFEWTRDTFDEEWYATGGNACSNCANLLDPTLELREPVMRGGCWLYGALSMRNTKRDHAPERDGPMVTGIRCARDSK